MNKEIIEIIEYLIGSFICCIGMFIASKIIIDSSTIEKKKIKNKIINILIIIGLSTLLFINKIIFDQNVARLFGLLLVIFVLYKLVCEEKIKKCIVLTFITCLIITFGEITFSIPILLIKEIFKLEISNFYTKFYISNIIIAGTFVGYTYLLRKKINDLLTNISNGATNFVISLMVIIVTITFVAIYNLLTMEWQISYNLIINIVIIIAGLVLLFIAIRQYLKNRELIDKYYTIEDYLKTSAELIEKYSSGLHCYKNKLIEIKGYLGTDINKAEQCIDKILDKCTDKKYSWFSMINYIKLDVIRYLVYYKLSKAEENNLKIMVDISKDIDGINETNLSFEDTSMILEILGEYFDNAIYAANESAEKELICRMYREDAIVTFEIANTYKEKVDLHLLLKNGYTTKGKDHGLGLYSADKVIKVNQFIKHEFDIVDNYFIVRLRTDYNKNKFTK